MTLLRRGRTISAILNITVSNLTNLWLALIGLLVFQIIH
jgi:cation:H+ antiporter